MLALAIALALPVPDVLDVDATNGPFFEISDAVLAASEGDVIFVGPGIYGSFAIHGKSLTLLATTLDRPKVDGTVRIMHLSPSQTVVMRGFEIEPVPHIATTTGPAHDDEALILAFNAGSIRLSRLEVDGGDLAAAHVLECTDVSISGSTFVGGGWHFQTGIYSFISGSWPAFLINQSRVAMHSTDCVGWTSRAGIEAVSSTELFLNDVRAFGGDGINGDGGLLYCDVPSTPGGHGVQLDWFSRATVVPSPQDGADDRRTGEPVELDSVSARGR
ncbi:MAG: hypothetical protein AAFP86_23450, partial [Planctomycetota bacterium]